jgi:DNA-binding NarL/FixJ family response regulator
MLRVLIADDHPLFRDGLRRLVGQLGESIETAEAGTLAEACTSISGLGGDVDLMLIDLRMPGMNGFEGIKALKTLAPKAPLVVVSGFESRRNAEQSLEAGAAGFIPKSAPVEMVLSALNHVLAGEIYLPPSLYGPTAGGDPTRDEHMSRRVDSSLFAPLTQRQIDVLALLGQGKSNKDIADTLRISEGTVKVHVGAILKVLSASNRTQAALLAIDAGIAGRSMVTGNKS